MDSSTAFVRGAADGAVEIVVNFGPLSGREATIAEVDRLARRLLAHLERVRLHATRTHEVSRSSEGIVHQVVVELDAPMEDTTALLEICESWALDCAEDRSLEPLGP